MCEVVDYTFDVERNDLSRVCFANGVTLHLDGLQATINYKTERHTTYRYDPRGRLRGTHDPLLSPPVVWQLLCIARELNNHLQQQQK